MLDRTGQDWLSKKVSNSDRGSKKSEIKLNNQVSLFGNRDKKREELRRDETDRGLGSGVGVSVTRLGDLLHFGQIFKACGDNYFAQITHILDTFCKVVEIFHFSSEIIFGQLF